MQYIRRRIQRVSGVTIRDERIESRDFPVRSFQEDQNGNRHEDRDHALSQAEALQRIGGAHRQRT